ncbi:MAG: hypothetical protein K2W85_07940 [Phycisphaerales bacterium]|nr:hypothetical protein [Phycisphaerales bacterium]
MKLTRHPLLLSAVAGRFPTDASVVRKLEVSSGLLEAHAEAFSLRFYEQLFAAYPGLRGMFPEDLTKLRVKLFDSLKLTVALLREPEKELRHLAEMGARHAGYGAKPEHYPIVVNLMVRAMEHAVGPAWTPDFSTEWTTALGLISEIMISAAESGGGQAATA